MPLSGRPYPDPGYSPGAVNTLNYRMLPPASGPFQTRTVNGRTYTGTAGVVQTVPDCDGRVLEANGWTLIAVSGPTASRPPTYAYSPYRAVPGFKYWDEQLGEMIIFDGAIWRDESGSPA